jgi:outer membrane protein assembly factor BamB
MVFGNAELPWLDVAKVVGYRRNQVAYAHTYLHSPRGGRAQIVVEHAHGLKVRLNGREVYRRPQRDVGLGFYVGISRQELDCVNQSSPRFDMELQPGWNRLLLKLSTSPKEGFTEMRCCLRIMDPPDVPYQTKNVLWMAELPARSTATPILVGDRIFVMCEPDELVAIDKNTGKILWSAATNCYEALTPAERTAHPALAERVDPLAAQLKAETDRSRRTELRRTIRDALLEIDREGFALRLDGHFESHFGIVGFTMPTPVSDGRCVYVWCGMGVAACYDLEGNRKWITRVPTGDLSYGSSPALADGVLAVFLNRLYGLDARTGVLRWEQHRIHKNIAAILAARLAGQNVFISQQGEVIRPSDGALLFRPRGIGAGDTGWSPPVVLGDTVHVPCYGVSRLTLLDFARCGGDAWKPETLATVELPDSIHRLASGDWLDRWTAGSPLVWQGLAYQVDIYGVLYVADLKTGGMVYRQPLAIEGLMHYNAVPVAASPTLIGPYLYVLDNQGTTLVLQPGREFRQVARNRIATQLERRWPIPAQETLAYAPPIVDGNRIYLRGERYLYCIGEPDK